jgi:hypothetical protein
MLQGIVMIEDQEDAKKDLNSSNPHINRGFELMLRQQNWRKKLDPPKTFQIKFGKMVSLFRREIVLHLNFYLDIRKK